MGWIFSFSPGTCELGISQKLPNENKCLRKSYQKSCNSINNIYVINRSIENAQKTMLCLINLDALVFGLWTRELKVFFIWVGRWVKPVLVSAVMARPKTMKFLSHCSLIMNRCFFDSRPSLSLLSLNNLFHLFWFSLLTGLWFRFLKKKGLKIEIVKTFTFHEWTQEFVKIQTYLVKKKKRPTRKNFFTRVWTLKA